MTGSQNEIISRPYVSAIGFLVFGLFFAALGLRLSVLGGSPFYAAYGIALICTAVFLWRRSRIALTIYSGVLLMTAIWALFEAGTGFWGLEVRLLMPTIMGAWLLLPKVRRALTENATVWPVQKEAIATATVMNVAILIVAAIIAPPDEVTGQLSRVTEENLKQPDTPNADWIHYGGSSGGDRFSDLKQITPQNVGKLKVAWTYSTGDIGKVGNFQGTPLKIRDTLYFCTPESWVIALDAATGQKKWIYKPEKNAGPCRGISYFDSRPAGAEKAPQAECDERLFVPAEDGHVAAIDTVTGKLCAGFGNSGRIDLRKDLGDVPRGFVKATSAPLVIKGKLVVGTSVADNQYDKEPSGVVRAYDARSGALIWAWDLGRKPTNKPLAPGEIFTRGTPNDWGPITADPELGLIYLATGNATPDYYGGQRRAFDDSYNSAIVAVDADSGAERWHFQTVHHDLWDMDLPTSPSLMNIGSESGGAYIPALIQTTKRGEIFVLDRRNGKPVVAVAEKPVATGDIPGEHYSPTQPYTVGMPSFSSHRIRETDAWGATPIDQLLCRIEFRSLRYDGEFTPTSLKGTLVYPAYFGVTDWGGATVDPTRQIVVQNMNHLPWVAKLIPRKEALDEKLISAWDGKGNPPAKVISSMRPQYFTPFAVSIRPWINDFGVPCLGPPFGEIAALDMKKRVVLWRHSFGTTRHNGPFDTYENVPLPTGIFSMGGGISTAGGLIFIGATSDRQFRAIDVSNGRELWSAELPAGGHATPMTYMANGRQFVVIPAGGHWGMKGNISDKLVAFSLPAS